MSDKRALEESLALGFFVAAMSEKLILNRNKGGWEGDSFQALFERAKDELKELQEELVWQHPLEESTPEQLLAVVRECADVANFVMFIAEKARRLMLTKASS